MTININVDSNNDINLTINNSNMIIKTLDNIITKDLVKTGYEQNVIKLIDTYGGTMCGIGEYCFFFGGELAEKVNAGEYKRQVPTETIIDEIFDTLEAFKSNKDFEDEYEYYYWYLMENVKKEDKVTMKSKKVKEVNVNNYKKVLPRLGAIHAFNNENFDSNWLKNFKVFHVDDDGTITCQISDYAMNVHETQSLPIALLWEDDLDAILVGEDGCTGNFDMYTPIFISRFNTYYLVSHSVSEDFSEDKEVKLYAKELTEGELEELLEWAENH